MRLIDINNDAWIKISSFESAIQRTMLQYGIFPGDVVRVVRRAPLGGPLLLEVSEREIALGRRIAEKIFVERM
jgi:Fe2+ transport system protein FeoA